MKITALSRKIKIALMAVTVLGVTLLGLVGGVNWAGVALANDDPPGTVPIEPQTFVSGPIVEELPEPEPGECGLGLVSDTTPAFLGDSLLRVLEIQPGTSQLGSSLGVASFSADTVAPEVLPASPRGYDLLSCGILTSGQSTLGGPVAIFRRGPVTCFPIPPGYVPTIHYYDPTPGIQRWVRLVTLVDLENNEACTSLRLPALLALFGQPIVVPQP
jgi:hypothetical protein